MKNPTLSVETKLNNLVDIIKKKIILAEKIIKKSALLIINAAPGKRQLLYQRRATSQPKSYRCVTK